MKVLKFGGSSVASPESIIKIKNIVNGYGDKIIVVVSAFGGITDELLIAGSLAANQDLAYKDRIKVVENRHLNTIKELIPITAQSKVLSKVKSELNILEALLEGAYLIGEITEKLSDKIVSYGELLSSYIISEYFSNEYLDCVYKDSRELIKTFKTNNKNTVDFKITNSNCADYFNASTKQITVCPGFIASSFNGDSTTLGRGGSDYTAAIFAAALQADVLEIWTDVSGMFTANPKMVKQAKAIEHISYEEAMELSHFGAKVLYPPTIQPVLAKGISIIIKNTFSPEQNGTLITKSKNEKGKTVRGISHIDNI
ncbi:MAG: aspartate kinase, partial [Maribacter sp.]